MVAADPDPGLVQLRVSHRGIRGAQFRDRGGLRDGDVVERAQRPDHDASQDQAVDVDLVRELTEHDRFVGREPGEVAERGEDDREDDRQGECRKCPEEGNGRERVDAVCEVERDVRDRGGPDDRDEDRAVTLEDRRQDELQDHDEADHDPTQRREAAPAAEQNDGDREDGCQPDQRGAALAIGVRVAEAGIRAPLIGEDDAIAAAEVGVGRRIERERERLAAALVGPLGQPHVGEVAGDPFGRRRSGARTGVQPNDLRFVDLACEEARYGGFHVRAESDHEHPHDHEQREPGLRIPSTRRVRAETSRSWAWDPCALPWDVSVSGAFACPSADPVVTHSVCWTRRRQTRTLDAR